MTAVTFTRNWRDAAACIGVDPDTFYPLDLDPASPGVVAAKRVCTRCPVRSACLADVMAAEDPARRWGVTAGLAPNERAALYAGSRVTPADETAVA